MQPLTLPDAVRMFFALGNGEVASSLSQCLADDAVVYDEGGVHAGHAAIADWMREVRQKYGFTAEPRTMAWGDTTLTVRTRVSGRFPGSPIELDYVFRMEADRIAELRIG